MREGHAGKGRESHSAIHSDCVGQILLPEEGSGLREVKGFV